MKPRWALLAGNLLLVTAMTLGIPGVAPAGPGDNCTLAKLDALYVLTASGFNIVSGVPEPKAIVELIRFNGDGTADVPGGRVSINGSINPTGGTGTYTDPAPVDKGCEAILTFASGPTWYMFLPPNGQDIQALQTNPNTVFRGTMTKVSH